MKGLFLLLLLFISSVSFSFGEDSTSVQKDSIKLHSPKKAVIYSAIIPGGGQIYNHMAMPKGKRKAFWKVPLIYAGLGASTYFLISNQSEQKALRTEYSFRTENPGLTSNTDYENYNDNGVLTLYNQYLDWRDLSILALASVYLFQIIDAGVEAHFVSFDISEDLSFNLDPTVLNYRTAGLKMSFNFR